MRYLLPAVAAAIAVIAAPASAQPPFPPQGAPGERSHVALHLSTHTVLNGRFLSIRGRVRPAGPHRIQLVVRGPSSEVAHLTTKANGFFVQRWSPKRIGTYEVHADDLHDQGSGGSVSVARRLTSFHPALVSYYGPGLYGGALACGGILRPGTLGVASKTLPCGTLVSLRYRARAITVPVIDRGPYVAGREFDLTAATRARLDFPGLGVLLSNH